MAKVQALTDREALRELVQRMPPRERQEYDDYACLELESAFPGRRMIVFDLKNGEPWNIEDFLFTTFMYPAGGEPCAEYRFQGDGRFESGRVGMVPSRYANREVFLSIPQKFEFRWGGRRAGDHVSFHPHFGLLIKTRHKLLHRVDGTTYCVSLKRFQSEFPAFADHVRY
jgi:hypothetical protein